jgi:hypothetical protein
LIYYDRKGRPISDTLAWARLFEDKSYKVLKQEMVGPYWVSTVWLGLDHRFGIGPPLIFETMVFWRGENPQPDSFEEDQERYSTEEEALTGHARIVEFYRTKLPA